MTPTEYLTTLYEYVNENKANQESLNDAFERQLIEMNITPWARKFNARPDDVFTPELNIEDVWKWM